MKRFVIFPIILLLFSPLLLADFEVRTYRSDFSLESERSSFIVCPDAQFYDIVRLVNDGERTARYLVRVVSDVDGSHFSVDPSIVEVMPNDSTEFSVEVTQGKGTVVYDIVVQDLLTKTERLIRHDVLFTSDCQNLLAGLNPDTRVVYQCDRTRFDLFVKNTGQAVEEYEVHVEPFEATFEKDRFSLGPGDRFDQSMYIDVPCDVIGKEQIAITVAALDSGYETVFEPTIDIIEVSRPEVRIEPIPRLCPGQYNFSLFVRNTDMRPDNYALTVRGSEFIRLPSETEMVGPDDVGESVIEIVVPDKDLDKRVTIEARSKGADHVYGDVSFPLTFLSKSSCHQIDIVSKDYTVHYDQSVVPIALHNVGIAGGYYYVETDSDIFSLSERVYMEGGDQLTLNVSLRTLDDMLPGVYVHDIVLYHPASGQRYEYPISITLAERPLPERVWLFFASFGLRSLLFLLVLVLIIVALRSYVKARKTKKTNRPRLTNKEQKVLDTVSFILFLCTILLILYLVTLDFPKVQVYEMPINASNYTLMYHQWGQDGGYILNASRYFYDPDGEALAYTTTQPQNISVHVEGSLIYLDSDHGWWGKRSMLISAHDAYNDTVRSPPLTLEVVKRREFTFADIVHIYINHITLMMLISIFIVLVFLIRVTGRR